MNKHTRRRKQVLAELTKVRLELFFFDEKVQLATQSLAYIDSHQGSQSLEHLGFFDFGRPCQEIIQEQIHYRQRLPSSNFVNNLDNLDAMRRCGSFLYKEYSAPDYSDIKKALAILSD